MIRILASILTFCILILTHSDAQTISKILPLDGNDGDGFGEAVAMNAIGDWVIIGSPRDSDISSTAGSAYIYRRNGINWQEHAKLSPNDIAPLDNFGHAVALSGNGNFAIVSSIFDDDNGDDSGSAYIFAKQGNTWIQQTKLTASNGATMDWFGQSVAIDSSGNTAIIGAYQSDGNGSNSGSAYIYTRNGNIWTEQTQLIASDASVESQFGFDVSISNDGNRVAIGTFFATGTGKAYIFDNDSGNWQETTILSPSDNPTTAWFGRSLSLSGNGNSIAVGAAAVNSAQGAAYVFENNGNWMETNILTASDGESNDNFGVDISINSDGTKVFVAAFGDDDQGNNSGAVYLFENNTGNWAEDNKFSPSDLGDNDNFGESIAINDSGDYLISGNKNDDDNGFLSGSSYIYNFSNLLIANGRLIADTNNDCLEDTGDIPIPDWLIEFKTGTDRFLANTNLDGSFEMPILPLGTYTVKPIIPNPYWEVCSADLSFENTTGTEELNLTSIIVQPVVQCPYMEVNIVTPNLERCYDNTYYINYSNAGTDLAPNVSIDITLDPFLTLISSSIPFSSQAGNTYTFDVGDVAIFETGSFILKTNLSCDAVLGQNHCTSARISPNTYCFPSWDGSRIEVEENCISDQMEFRIQNIGTGNMLIPSKFQILEDMIMRVDQEYQIDAGNEDIYNFDVDGGTINFQTYQEAGYPYPDSLISISFEGCGAATPQMLGIFSEFPDNDEHPYVSIDCRVNTGAYDPNDKQAFPVGYEEDHLILNTYDLEYLIRFQNTGTDTAHQVIILDTLSTLLDPTSLHIEIASHPFVFEALTDSILKFTFNDIMLPDSLSNPDGSQGFIKFTISQKHSNPIGSIINNDAAIYFDYNEPVITNNVFHTIGEDYIIVDLLDNINNINHESIQINISPNPFVQELWIQIQSEAIQESIFTLTDITGRTIYQKTFNNSTYHIELPQLPSGIYPYQIHSEGQLLKTGKLITK